MIIELIFYSVLNIFYTHEEFYNLIQTWEYYLIFLNKVLLDILDLPMNRILKYYKIFHYHIYGFFQLFHYVLVFLVLFYDDKCFLLNTIHLMDESFSRSEEHTSELQSPDHL